MSNYVFPTLQGLTYDSVRSPHFNTGVQKALSSKESRIAYQQYPQWNWELIYEYLSPTDLLAIQGLFIAVQGEFDTFLYSDPLFNSVTAQQFAVGNGTAGPFPITANYGNSGGPSGPELIQNFNGAPAIYVNGTLQTPTTAYTLSGTGAVTFNSGYYPASGAVLTWTGAFYYRVRFDADDMDVSQFMNNFFELKKLKFVQVKI